MDEKLRATGTVVSHVILLVLGVILLPVSAGMLLSFPHWLFWLGVLLLFACCLFFYTAVAGLRRGSRQAQQFTKVQQLLTKVPAPTHAGNKANELSTLQAIQTPFQHEQFEPGQLLVQWLVPREEWKAFYKIERNKRLESMWIESILIALLGTVLLLMVRNASWFQALLLATGLALVWWIAKYYLHLRVMQSNQDQNQIIITTSSVQVNGRLHVYYDNHVTPGSFQLLTNHWPQVLEIRYHWQTRRGATFEELRVPVPAGKETEAQALVKHLSSFLPEPVVADGIKTGK